MCVSVQSLELYQTSFMHSISCRCCSLGASSPILFLLDQIKLLCVANVYKHGDKSNLTSFYNA